MPLDPLQPIDALVFSPREAALAFALPMLRVLVMLFVCPIANSGTVAWQLRFVVAGAWALALWPLVDTAAIGRAPMPFGIVWLLAKELLVGLVLGIVFALPLWLAEGVGVVFDNHRGAMTGSTFNPLLSSPSPLGALMQMTALVLVYQTGAIAWVLDAVAASFRVWPAESLAPRSVPLDAAALVELFGETTRAMLSYYAPVFAALVIVELALSLISLYAPTLQVFQMAMPVKSLVGGVLLVLLSTLFWDAWSGRLLDHVQHVLHLMELPHVGKNP